MDRGKSKESTNGGVVDERVVQETGQQGEERTQLDVELVLRLLTGDERTIFRTIIDSDGAMFQKDVVNKTKMSDAKVSRVLDHLEERGLVTRERQGMTNRIAVKGR